MASNPTTLLNHGLTQILPDEEETTPYSTPRFRPSISIFTSGGRTSSFSLPSPSHDSRGRSVFESPSFYFNEELMTPTFNFNPSSTLSPLDFKGIPFSWEEIPGIPKHQGRINYKKEPASSRSNLLPLPPPAGSCNNISSTKKVQNQERQISPKKHHNMIGNNNFQRWDPFFAALIECSKDDRDHDHGTTNINAGSKNIITRTLSDRFGCISMYSSCKRTCAVSESIVYHPR